MHLIQLLLPLYDNDGHLLPASLHQVVQKELTETWGGLTAYTRSPAEGHWKDGGQDVSEDVVVYEVMTPMLDTQWWATYRKKMEKMFHQSEVMIRATSVQRL